MTERKEFWDQVQSRLVADNFSFDQEFDIDSEIRTDTARTIVSMHDFGGPGEGLQKKVGELRQLAASLIKIAVTVQDAVDAIEVWNLLGPDTSVVPIAMGEAGKWTRVLGLAHGSPMTYASPDRGSETAPGQITAADLKEVFRVKELDRQTDVYGVIAGDTSYSLSPYMHNAVFKQLSLNAVFVPLQIKDLDAFIRRMVKPETREVELHFAGFSVTNPHKQTIMKHLDFVDETAKKIGAVNTVKVDDGKLYGYNTDALGFIAPLKAAFGNIAGARVAVAGAGGAARACVFALQQEGAVVALPARYIAKAAALADKFVIKFEAIKDKQKIATDILVNATPLGTRGTNETRTIATANELRDVKLVYDLVYNPSETRLLSEAKSAGAKTIGGIDMLIAQGAQQILIWTGEKAPVDLMKSAITERLFKTNAA
jgi:3-dehydroquinate dehydratase/shikimate dehydrogenase